MPIIFGRKKKDTAGIADVASGKSKSYVTISRRSVNPQTGVKIKKGSEVTSAPTRRMIGTKTISMPGKISIARPSVRVTSKFHPADMASGAPIKRETTPAHASMHNEHPGKVALRMKSQAEGKTSYQHPATGKHEMSGIREDKVKFNPGSVSIGTKSVSAPVFAQGTKLKVTSPKASVGVRLKPRSITMGGSDRSGAPATKHGVGTKRGVILKRKAYPL